MLNKNTSHNINMLYKFRKIFLKSYSTNIPSHKRLHIIFYKNTIKNMNLRHNIFSIFKFGEVRHNFGEISLFCRRKLYKIFFFRFK